MWVIKCKYIQEVTLFLESKVIKIQFARSYRQFHMLILVSVPLLTELSPQSWYYWHREILRGGTRRVTLKFQSIANKWHIFLFLFFFKWVWRRDNNSSISQQKHTAAHLWISPAQPPEAPLMCFDELRGPSRGRYLHQNSPLCVFLFILPLKGFLRNHKSSVCTRVRRSVCIGVWVIQKWADERLILKDQRFLLILGFAFFP